MMANALTENPTLKDLRLVQCGIGVAGASSIADALKSNNVLEVVQ